MSYGLYVHPILYGLPSGAVACANGTYAFVCVWLPSAQLILLPSVAVGSSVTRSPCGIGWVGHEFTSGAVLTGTGVSLIS